MNKVELKLKNPNLTKCGDLYLIDKEVNILSHVGYDKYVLIGLTDGVRWSEIFDCRYENLTVDNIIAIIRKDDEDWEDTIVEYIGNKTIVIKEN